jgi:hypothetical protein
MFGPELKSKITDPDHFGWHEYKKGAMPISEATLTCDHHWHGIGLQEQLETSSTHRYSQLSVELIEEYIKDIMTARAKPIDVLGSDKSVIVNIDKTISGISLYGEHYWPTLNIKPLSSETPASTTQRMISYQYLYNIMQYKLEILSLEAKK